MADNFVSYDRDTLFLMPPSVQDWLPDKHLARFVVDLVAQLDLRAMRASYDGRGSAAYHPEMLVALLFYSYATGMRASRKIENATYDSVAFRYTAANTHPDRDTIASFRRRFLPHLEIVFDQILVLAKEMHCLEIGRISLDGTKIKANASKHRALSLKGAHRIEAQLRNQAKRMLELAEEADRADEVSKRSRIFQRNLHVEKIGLKQLRRQKSASRRAKPSVSSKSNWSTMRSWPIVRGSKKKTVGR